MFGRFIKIFIKDSDDVENPRVRENYGKLTGITGIVLNLILCAAKIITGAVTGAISVLSDGVNNLSDAASSVITLAGFKISAKKPDKEHPFGHGRMEYFAGLLVSLIILLVAFELFSESVSNIIAGKTPSFGSDVVRTVTLCVLAVSIAVKLWKAHFNRYFGKKINSVAMRATAADSASDCVSTAVVLVCTALTALTGDFPLDACAGIVVSLFIFYTGVKSVRDILDLYDRNLMDEVYVVFTRMISSSVHEPEMVKLLPIEAKDIAADVKSTYTGEICYDPSPKQVLDVLVPQYLVGMIYSTLIHSTASEHASRMMAMSNANKNAEKMLDMLDLEYNRLRQSAITTELLDLSSGRFFSGHNNRKKGNVQ